MREFFFCFFLVYETQSFRCQNSDTYRCRRPGCGVGGQVEEKKRKKAVEILDNRTKAEKRIKVRPLCRPRLTRTAHV
jgi:hypothetical protein